MPGNAEDYRKKAAEFEQKAKEAADPRVRRTFSDMAVLWRQLAEESDGLAALRKNLESGDGGRSV